MKITVRVRNPQWGKGWYKIQPFVGTTDAEIVAYVTDRVGEAIEVQIQREYPVVRKTSK